MPLWFQCAVTLADPQSARCRGWVLSGHSSPYTQQLSVWYIRPTVAESGQSCSPRNVRLVGMVFPRRDGFLEDSEKIRKQLKDEEDFDVGGQHRLFESSARP